MQVFDSLQQLGYSSINIILVFLLVSVIIYRSFHKYLGGRIARALFFAGVAAAFVFSVNYLAEVNKVAEKAYKAQRAAEKAEGKAVNN